MTSYSKDILCKSRIVICFSTASRSMISSHSWTVDLSNKDGYAEVEPRMKYFDADTFNLNDPDMAEHRDFLNWEDDY